MVNPIPREWTVLEECVVPDMPEAIYHADPVPSGSLSQSGAKYLLPPYTPKHFAHYRATPRKASRAQQLGTAAHGRVLHIGAPVFVLPKEYKNYNKQAAQKLRDDATDAGIVPLLKHENDKIEAMAAALRDDPDVAALLDPDAGRAEVSIFWIDPETGVWQRMRADWIPEPNAAGEVIVVDYKGLALDTAIPTPTGWTTMAALAVGDQVFGSNGRPCTVTGKSEVHWRTCYRIRFDDGTTVICDDEHLWRTTHGSYVNRAASLETSILTTTAIRDTLLKYGQHHHRVALAGVLDLPDAELPVDPYLLGYWLGDGWAWGGLLTVGEQDRPWLMHALTERGCTCRSTVDQRNGTTYSLRITGLTKQLNAAGYLRTRTVPAPYLRASARQRLDLLRGLMDSDGSWNPLRKQAVFTTVNKELAEQVRDLACGLGQRAVVLPYIARGFGLVRQAYRVCWRPVGGLVPFALPRKADPVAGVGPGMSNRRVIVAVEEMPTVPTQCIEVDSPDHTYLCTEGMVPTHNTISRQAHAALFAKQIFDFGYYIQNVWYRTGIAAHPHLSPHRPPSFVWIVQETEPPFAVQIFELEPEDEVWGEKQMRAALRLYARCAETGNWHGHPTGIQRVGLPRYGLWQLRDLERNGAFYDPEYDGGNGHYTPGDLPVYGNTYRGWDIVS